jgi:hypothetical protein
VANITVAASATPKLVSRFALRFIISLLLLRVLVRLMELKRTDRHVTAGGLCAPKRRNKDLLRGERGIKAIHCLSHERG